MRLITRTIAAALIASAAGVASGYAQEGKTQGVSDTEILFGVHSDQSGPVSNFGIATAKGMQMRIKEANDAGGVFGRKLRLIVEDTQYQMPLAISAVNKLVNSDQVMAIVGAQGSAMVNGTEQTLLAAGVPSLFPAASARSMFEPFRPMQFILQAPYYSHARVAAKYLIDERKRTKICSMAPDSEYGQETTDAVTDEAASRNLQAPTIVNNKLSDTDYSYAITSFKNAGCDGIVLGGVVKDTILFYSQSRRNGLEADIVAGSGGYDSITAQAAGGVTDGLFGVGYFDLPDPGKATGSDKEWIDRYMAEYNETPIQGSVLGYMYMDLTVKALEKAGQDLTTAKLLSAIETVSEYDGLFNGPKYSFSPTKHVGTEAGSIYQVKGGVWERLTEPLSYSAVQN